MSTRVVTAARPADDRPGLDRLVGVELRKMVDTRAGLWLQLTIALATLAVVVAGTVTGSGEDHELRTVLELAAAPSSILLPVVGVLLVSSEWSQRTALVTFALVPDRGRILAAKVLASVVLSLAALVLCLVLSVTAVALTGDGTYTLSAGLLAQDAFGLATSMISGVAFGAAFLASAPAIVAFFALPTVWAAVGSLAVFKGVAGWLDGSRTLVPLNEELLSADQWARVGATLAVWMVLPLLVGGWRIVRGEVR